MENTVLRTHRIVWRTIAPTNNMHHIVTSATNIRAFGVEPMFLTKDGALELALVSELAVVSAEICIARVNFEFIYVL